LSRIKVPRLAARKLLTHFGVYHCDEALDGPKDRDLLIFLASYSGVTEEEVTQATARVGRLAELAGAINAAKFLEICANKAAQEATHFDKLLPKGHHGDIAATEWFADMMSLYKKITGREPRLSVRRPYSSARIASLAWRRRSEKSRVRLESIVTMMLGCAAASSWNSSTASP
jgi:hypothetical protein